MQWEALYLYMYMYVGLRLKIGSKLARVENESHNMLLSLTFFQWTSLYNFIGRYQTLEYAQGLGLGLGMKLLPTWPELGL